MKPIIKKNLVLRYFDDQRKQDESSKQIALTMSFLDDSDIDLTTDEMFSIACRLFEMQQTTNQPFLREELNDALRYIISEGISCFTNQEIDSEYAYNFLMNCSQELFNYIIAYEAVENHCRFKLAYPQKLEGKRVNDEIYTVMQKIKLPEKMPKVEETMIDIALAVAPHVSDISDQIDSRALISEIWHWAYQFEAQPHDADEDYLLAIDKFVEERWRNL